MGAMTFSTAPRGTHHDVENPPVPAAVLWDLDGTLIDSEPYWMAEESALVHSYGGHWPKEMADQLVGNALLDSADFIRANSPVTMAPRDIVTTLTDGVVARLRERIPWRPGARELLAELVEAGVPCALVTMSWRTMVDAVVDQLPGMFETTLSGDEVERGKPDPLAYRMAADAVGVPISDCVALEDSEVGVTSAYDAGARTICIPLMVEVAQRPGLAYVDTLEGLTPADLVRITDAARG